MEKLAIKPFMLLLFLFVGSNIIAQEVKYKGSGYYYDLLSKKHVGEVNLKLASWGSFDSYKVASIKFKSEKSDKKTVSVKEISSMVIEKDSFIVVDNFEISRKDLAEQSILLEKEFLKVSAVGKITIYQQFFNNVAEQTVYTKELAVKNGDTTSLRSGYGFYVDKEIILGLIRDDMELYQEWNEKKKSEFRKSYLTMVSIYNERNR